MCNEYDLKTMSEVVFWTAVHCMLWLSMKFSKEMADVQWMCTLCNGCAKYLFCTSVGPVTFLFKINP